MRYKGRIGTSLLAGVGVWLAAQAASAEPLADIALPLCSSVDADAASDTPRSPNCSNPSPDVLAVELTASRGEITIGDYKIADAYLYNGSYMPEVWRIDPGDTIDVRFSNELSGSFGQISNIHTHGMLVTPINAGGTNLSEPMGDNILPLFASTALGPINPEPAPSSAVGSLVELAQAPDSVSAALGFICRNSTVVLPVVDGSGDYSIPIPSDHPVGLFWYHPHPHGLSEAQVGGGLAGLMTVGLPNDYIGDTPDTGELEHRLLMLKDLQLTREAGDEMWHVNDTPSDTNCSLTGDDADKVAISTGVCLNGDDMAWLFTVNGQLYPTIEVDEGHPQLWRIANTGADITYNLELVETLADGSERKLPFQIVSVDGVAVGQPNAESALVRDSLLMMPSSRIEIYVAYDDGSGRSVPEEGAHAVLRQAGFLTGEKPGEGATWPPVDLTEVVFVPTGDGSGAPAPSVVNVEGQAPAGVATSYAGSGDESCPRLGPDESRMVVFNVQEFSADQMPGVDYAVPPNCPIAPGDENFFNTIGTTFATVGNPSSLDEILTTYDKALGDLYATSFGDTTAANRGKCFNAELDTCVPYPSVETWWVVNASNEGHNFHIHQSRFQVLEVVGTGDDFSPDTRLWHDNYPVLVGQAVKLRIHFDRPEQVGEFVYHCHILLHEDGGMMALMEVRDTGQ